MKMIRALSNEEQSKEKRKALDWLHDLSILPLPLVGYGFPFAETDELTYPYYILKVEPMHMFSLGISKTLMECVCTLLKYEERPSTSMPYVSMQRRPFKRIRKTILATLNAFLRLAQTSSPGYGLHVDFSKGECGGRIYGLFTETGILGMMEAAD